MHLDAVLLDFAGTLLVPVPARQMVRTVTGADDPQLAARLDAAGWPGGPEPATLPAGLTDDYARRDTSAQLHRDVYVALLRQAVDEPLATRFYEAAVRPDGWTPYPDAEPTLRQLRTQDIRVAVVSNVGFDLPAIFAGHGLAHLVDAFVLSCELGVMKPHPRVFRIALEHLDVSADRALMVGDNPRADSGAVDVGIRTLLLPYSPVSEPHGLDAVLRLTQIDSPSA